MDYKKTKPVKIKQRNKIVIGKGKPLFTIKSINRIIAKAK